MVAVAQRRMAKVWRWRKRRCSGGDNGRGGGGCDDGGGEGCGEGCGGDGGDNSSGMAVVEMVAMVMVAVAQR